ncbi:MAG: hypothetical protein AAB372_02795 [Patescibacteria group bacterium]
MSSVHDLPGSKAAIRHLAATEIQYVQETIEIGPETNFDVVTALTPLGLFEGVPAILKAISLIQLLKSRTRLTEIMRAARD